MKIRRLKTILQQRGYIARPGKGSHCIWVHPQRPNQRIVLAGGNNEDAHPYQVARVCRGQHFHRSATVSHSSQACRSNDVAPRSSRRGGKELRNVDGSS